MKKPRNPLSKLNAALCMAGVDVRRLLRTAWNLPRYLRDLARLRRELEITGAPFRVTRLVPCLLDRTDESGTASGAYFLQDLLVAGMVFRNRPEKHVDVGSSVAGFVAHVASFREIEVFDIRPLETQASNIAFRQADFMAEDVGYEEYTDSLSCLHTIEHFGLGRYGDRIDPNGHVTGIANLHRVLKPGGTLYFSTPIGPQRIEFNAHRVFALEHLLSLLEPRFTVKSFSYVNDDGRLFRDAELTPECVSSNFGCRYGIGILELEKTA
jgi:SAM-dependent methyltransferase